MTSAAAVTSGSDEVWIRTMRASDVDDALQLSTSVGWNQIAADWHRMYHLEPSGCFVAQYQGHVVGTTLCCLFGNVAWLAMVIVQENLRGRGLGSLLVQRGLDFARQHGIDSVRLDATPLGQHVYRRFGFEPQFELIRMGGVVRTSNPTSPPSNLTIRTASVVDLPALFEYDRHATHTDRHKLLDRLFSEWTPLVACSRDGRVHGFLAHREGRLAIQPGPCAGTRGAARALFRHALSSRAGTSVIADIPADQPELLAIASEHGLSAQRTLLRMCCGTNVEEDQQLFHLSYGGEFG
jgi:predicted N-acetyltransferase YhbS